jgi:2-phosphosulfolactate phosphatase
MAFGASPGSATSSSSWMCSHSPPLWTLRYRTALSCSLTGAGTSGRRSTPGRSRPTLPKRRTQSGFSLSPDSLRRVPSGYRLVLPSPNGGALSLAAFHAVAGGETVTFTACLRNAGAVTRAARQFGSSFAVIPAGERWPDGTLRPAVEDWIGAGAVLAGLPGRPSPEAAMAIAAFESLGRVCSPTLAGSISGRELIDCGFGEDVALAAELDASTTAPRLQDGGFVG